MTAFLIIAPCTPPLCWDLLESPHHISHLQTHTFKDYVAIIVPFPKKKKKSFCFGGRECFGFDNFIEFSTFFEL